MQLDKEVNEKFRKGDALTDRELNHLIDFYTEAHENAEQLGPDFRLMANELNWRLSRLRCYRTAGDEK